jgi:predicted nucleic acid-binding protein
MQSRIVVADTSVLINFLRIDRMDLIGHHPQRFLATDHVEAEITSDYPDQRTRYQAAVVSGQLDTCSVVDPDEVTLFLRLRPGERLGAGYPIAIDDDRAVKRAVREMGAKLEVVKTVDVIVTLIRTGVLNTDAADQIKDEWTHQHRFRIKAASFRDLL